MSDWTRWQPLQVRQRIQSLDAFVVENAKTARAFVKACEHPLALATMTWLELHKHGGPGVDPSCEAAMQLLLAGRDVGLMSEAGCPGVADPGSQLVALAHQQGIGVRPMVGPSSILMALMASGMNGQHFAFLGYLPQDPTARQDRLRKIEAHSSTTGQTQIFIETPYRNAALLAAIVQHCKPATRLAIACDLTLPSEVISVRQIAQWRGSVPDLQKRPATFLLDARAT
jgi:16S rRNA (cytidine1402-2'-O)-methyltransferase